jgi:hypothetical protein
MITSEPIEYRAGRIASLTEAATTICLGASLADLAKRETVVIDLLNTVTQMAERLAADTEGACYAEEAAE